MLLALYLLALFLSATFVLRRRHLKDRKIASLCLALIVLGLAPLIFLQNSPQTSLLEPALLALILIVVVTSLVLVCSLESDPANLMDSIKESGERFRDFARSCSDNFWEMDENLVFFADATAEYTPLPWSSIGKTRWELAGVDPDSDDYWRQHKQTLEAHLPFRDFYYSHQVGGGAIQHWKVSGMPVFDANGTFKGYRGTAAEMTESIEASRKAREAQKRLYHAIENISEGFVLWDADDRLVLCNSRYKEIFSDIRDICTPGSQFKEMLQDLLLNGFIPFETKEDQEAFLQARLDRRKHARREPLVIAVRDNRWLQVLERRTVDGGIVGIWTDITELKRRDQELAHAQKLEIVGQLTGSIAHDFNNFLAVILGNLEILKRRIGDDEKLGKFVQRSITGTQRAAALTQRLLAFSRKQAPQPRTIDLGGLIEGMRELITGCVGSSVTTEISVSRDLTHIEVDPNQLETAILNLILNARDAMSSGGHLTVTARNALPDDLKGHLPNIEAAEDFLAITVADTGVGIPSGLQLKVFEPFFTTKDAGKGSGLGLSMVDGFVRQSQGFLSLDSAESQGTRITLLLPKSKNPAAAFSENELPQFEPRGNGETILVVEDEKHVRELTVSLLQELGYRTLDASDGKAALEMLQLHAGEINLMLSDIVLPLGMNGAQLAQRAVELYPDLNVLFMSGYPQLSPEDNRMIELEQNLLHKPFRRSELAQRLRQKFDTHQQRLNKQTVNA